MTTIPYLTNRYIQLKQRLYLKSGLQLPEISVPLPLNNTEELSFYRLVIWGYIVTQEAAKIPLGFLQALPPLSKSGAITPELSLLRTWIGHNLDLTKTADEKKIRSAQHWFRTNCGASVPSTSEHWEKCCHALIGILSVLFDGAIVACDLLDSEEDGERLSLDLKSRVDRNWEAYRFDIYATKAIERLGFSGINAVDLRRKNLDSWRKIISLSEPAQWDRLLNVRIEKDILDLMNDALPITADELKILLQLSNSEQVTKSLAYLKLFAKENRDVISDIVVALSSKAD